MSWSDLKGAASKAEQRWGHPNPACFSSPFSTLNFLNPPSPPLYFYSAVWRSNALPDRDALCVAGGCRCSREGRTGPGLRRPRRVPATAPGQPGVAGAALASLAPQAEIQGGSEGLLAPNRCPGGAERGLTSGFGGGGGGEPGALRDRGVRLPAPQLGPAEAGDDTGQAALPSALGAVGGAGTEELMCS